MEKEYFIISCGVYEDNYLCLIQYENREEVVEYTSLYNKLSNCIDWMKDPKEVIGYIKASKITGYFKPKTLRETICEDISRINSNMKMEKEKEKPEEDEYVWNNMANLKKAKKKLTKFYNKHKEK